LTVACLAGLYLRFYLLVRGGHSSDISLFTNWANTISDQGFWQLYSKNFYQNGLDYPPLVPLITSWWLELGRSIGVANLTTFFKLIPTVAEIIFSAITFYIIYQMKGRYKYLLLTLVILQPALVLVSEGWGQVDSMMALFALLGFVLMEKNPSISTFMMFLAILVKPQSAIAVGFYFLYFLVKKRYKVFVWQVVLFVLIFAAFGTIFYVGSRGGNVFDIFIHAVGRYTNSSLNAFNLWWALYGKGSWDIVDSSGIPSFKNVGLGFFLIFEIPALVYFFKKCRSLSSLLLVVAYSYFIFFVFPTEIHERYMFAAVALMAIPAMRYPKILWVYIVISTTFLVNVFAVLQSVYYPYDFLKFYMMDGSWTRITSLVNIAVAIYLAYYLYEESFRED